MTEHRSYHHGDLRKAVTDAALDVIAESGVGALSMRDLARRAGVSHAAPAHHFKDRAGLLTAIAAEGHDLLTAELAAEGEGLAGMGAAYVRFAELHPAHFQVMFRPDLVRADDPELAAARGRSAARLREGVSSLPGGADAELAGVAAWSMAHGFASLARSGALAGVIGDREQGEVFLRAAQELIRAQ
ncbi:TetR/AcrR family transcriptional regulator [Streptomyces sp. NPDC051940]|uniref:TetR/AcrR family transcriptional regulator n=1 Tax=Streptomyces sp. NPDC051940 TaxID=3155675 RepID=UPI0034206742